MKMEDREIQQDSCLAAKTNQSTNHVTLTSASPFVSKKQNGPDTCLGECSSGLPDTLDLKSASGSRNGITCFVCADLLPPL